MKQRFLNRFFAMLCGMILFFSVNVYAVEWVNISGTVYYNGQPLSVMVLANGQYMFTDMADGRYNLNVPPDSNGQITIFSFCDGLAPFKAVLNSWEAVNYNINMSASSEESQIMNISVAQSPSAKSGWVKLSGKVMLGTTSLCAMILANGQYMFSCAGKGEYELEVPLDNEGNITILGFCEGLLPYKQIITDTGKVVFPDKNLEAAIREAINKPSGDILKSNLQNLPFLTASCENIQNIDGLQYFTSLTMLDLAVNQISDISPLAELTNLTWLSIWSNQISDISPLAELTNLTWLSIWSNQISDISPLAELTNLKTLYFYKNQINNIKVLAGLTNLTELYLSWNQISDISALAGLINLIKIDLGYQSDKRYKCFDKAY